MVTRVLNDSTNQPTKKPKQQCSLSEHAKDRPSTSRLLFAPQPQTFQPSNMLPMPKIHSASLPVFDGKSERFELFEDLFRQKRHQNVPPSHGNTINQLFPLSAKRKRAPSVL